MQILGKRSKILLMGLLALMLITLGASFAVWDGQAALAATGDAAGYANAKVGDVIQFGRYWQKAMPTGYDDKDPIEWIVVDKDERTGQLTLMSKYILAECSYFGVIYNNNAGQRVDAGVPALLDNVVHNQYYAESTVRAFLNNLERWDLGGDKFDVTKGLDNENRIKSVSAEGKLKPSVGFSNSPYNTLITTAAGKALLNDPNSGIISIESDSLLYYKRPKVTDWTQRLARNGFYDEAFTKEEKEMIVPKDIAGQTSFRWPANTHTLDSTEYVPGTKDKVWLPSYTEINYSAGQNVSSKPIDCYMFPNDSISDVPFEYFEHWEKYSSGDSYANHLVARPTTFASYTDHRANASIPGWATDVIIDANLTPYGFKGYLTRTPTSTFYNNVNVVANVGFLARAVQYYSYGVRPCIILKY